MLTHYSEFTQNCVFSRPQTQLEQTTPERNKMRPVWYCDTSHETTITTMCAQFTVCVHVCLCVCARVKELAGYAWLSSDKYSVFLWFGALQPSIATDHNNRVWDAFMIYSGSSTLHRAWPQTQADATRENSEQLIQNLPHW